MKIITISSGFALVISLIYLTFSDTFFEDDHFFKISEGAGKTELKSGPGSLDLPQSGRKRDMDPQIAGIISHDRTHSSVEVQLWPTVNRSISNRPVKNESQYGVPENEQNEYVCDIECNKFQKYVQNSMQGKPKGAIYYLTRQSRLGDLRRSLKSVDLNFNFKYAYPVIIFHEADLLSSVPTIKSWTNSSLFFQEIAFKIPTFLSEPVIENIPCLSPIGYRHMCRFNSKLLYQHPIIKGLEYLWRLDDESLITRPVSYDVFSFMKSNNLMYGYIWIHRDSRDCVIDLWESTAKYIKKNNIPANSLQHWPSPMLYYNNFEISSLKLWMSQEYQAFIEYIDKLGGIYYHRWGDAPIKGIAVSLFVAPHQVHKFSDIGYKHNTFKNE